MWNLISLVAKESDICGISGRNILCTYIKPNYLVCHHMQVFIYYNNNYICKRHSEFLLCTLSFYFN